ncbi:hypothetical protein ACMSI6_04725 [Pseudomonas antarctica]|uniref:hypothetical protein n=1 Tax=Pseudomonas antarctica TaxID=219572 RepID=UPI00387A9E29
MPAFTSAKGLGLMHTYFLCSFLLLVAGCSTGPYLHPQSSIGQNALLSRTCPGPKAAMSFEPLSAELNWVHVLVYVAPPGTYSWPSKQRSVEPELRLFGRLYNPRHPSADTPLWVSAASPVVTVQLGSGKTYPITVKQLETGFDPRKTFSSATHGTPLSNDDIDDFTLTFPDIFVNGEKVPMAPIHFNKREERYAPVFNC